jgi:predicted Zn finger-like uncharacterized protein
MLITCPSCSTAYRVDPSSLGADGRQVRCARCRTTWLATAESAVPAEVLGAESRTGADGSAAAAPGEDASTSAAPGDHDLGANDWTVEAERERPPPQALDAVADAPSLVPGHDGDRRAGAARTIEPTSEDIETIASRRARSATARKARKRALGRPRLPLIIVVLAITLLALIHWRSAVVKVFPQAGSLFALVGLPVNLRGMEFENLKTSQEFQDGVTVLVVEGTIVNKTRSSVEVPRLRFALRNRSGQEIYAWTALPQRSTLGPEETLAFRTRLASPPSEGRDVFVRFFTRQDLASGVR